MNNTSKIQSETNNGQSSTYIGGACHIECAKEQSVIVQCMDQLNSLDGNDKDGAQDTQRRCLEPAVSSWISCCHAANERHASSTAL